MRPLGQLTAPHVECSRRRRLCSKEYIKREIDDIQLRFVFLHTNRFVRFLLLYYLHYCAFILDEVLVAVTTTRISYISQFFSFLFSRNFLF